MSNGIRLSEKHGLNPSLGVCFYCGEDTGEIALLGQLKDDAEAPRKVVLSINPCDKCKEKYADYTLLVEMERQFITRAYSRTEKDPTPTGRWVAIRKECLNVEKPSPVAYVDVETMHHILSQLPKD